MQIPTGSGQFGGRLPQVKQTVINNPTGGVSNTGFKGGDGFAALFTAKLDEIKAGKTAELEKIKASDKLDAENSLFEYQKRLDSVSNTVSDLYATGKLSTDDIAGKYQELKDKIAPPSFEKLDELSRKSFLLQQDKLEHFSQNDMRKQVILAHKSNSASSVKQSFLNAAAVVEQPNANLKSVQEGLDNNTSFQQAGEYSFGADWDLQKHTFNQQLESTFLSSQIKYASELDGVGKLKDLKTQLLNDEQFTYLSPLAKRQFTRQIDSLIDINVGRSLGKSFVDNMSELVDKTGDFSAVKAYDMLANYYQKNESGQASLFSIDTAKSLAKKIGITFDEARFNDDPKYTNQLQQVYFNQALDHYGSPVLAAVAIQAGDEAMSGWLKTVGDPRKDQISESDFINHIPDKKTQQIAKQISSEINNSDPDQLNIEASLTAIEHDKSLNANQKRYAKSQFRQFAEELQQKQQAAYRDNHQTLWRDIYMNKTPLSEIEPERINKLTEHDQTVLLNKPKTTLDVATYSEAKGRLKAGEDFNVLKEYGDKVPVNQLDELLTLQDDLNNNPVKKNALLTTTAMISDRGKFLSLTDKGDMSRLNDSVTEEIADLESNKGRKATQQEKMDIADRHILKMKLDQQYFGGNKQDKVYQPNAVTTVDHIPTAKKQQIIAALTEEDLPITDENIVAVYQGGSNDDRG